MDNLFDDARDIAFDITTTVMGTQASWTPSTGGPTQTAGIHFNDPDALRKLGDIEFLPENSTMEYRKPNFPELKPNIDSGTIETVVINGESYDVRTVKAMEDGNTLMAVLQKL